VIVRKVRGQNKVGKITLLKTEVDMIRKMGLSVADYVRHALLRIAKERRWKWYFDKEKTDGKAK
jgi:hypothetical protein